MRRVLLLGLAVSTFAFTAATGNLSTRLAQWKRVNMPLDMSAFTLRQKQVVMFLIQASQELEAVYWRQSDPAGLQLFGASKNPDLKRMLMINGGRFDLVDENRPFVGDQAAPPGRALYPAELTRQMVEQYVAEHPAQKNAIYNPYTVVAGAGKNLTAIPYHVIYGQQLQLAAGFLKQAAASSDDAEFAKFLRLRADALLSDDYYPSDLAWVDLKAPKIDVIFGPNETYLDNVLGVKTSYEAAVLLRDEEESARLTMYQKYIPEIQQALPIEKRDLPSKNGQPTPMEVVNAPFRTGDLLHGYQAVADNLPNDPRVHEAKGTKKIFFRNFMDARVKYIVLPVASQMMVPEQAAKASAEGYLAAVVLHEISHGLGPSYSRVNGVKKDIREAVGPVYAALEESKADVVGMAGLAWLMQHGALPHDRSEEFYASYLAGIFRSIRYGVAEAHGRAEMMEFNYLVGQNAIGKVNGRYRIDFSVLPAALASLAKELLTIEATGDHARAEDWFNRYDKMPPDLTADLKKLTNIPIDIEPVFSIPVLPH